MRLPVIIRPHVVARNGETVQDQQSRSRLHQPKMVVFWHPWMFVADECWGSAGPTPVPCSRARIIFVDRLAGVNGPEWELNNWGSLTPGECHRLNSECALPPRHAQDLSLGCYQRDSSAPIIPILCAQDRTFPDGCSYVLHCRKSCRNFPRLWVPRGWSRARGREALAGKWLNRRVSVVETAASRSLVPHSVSTQTA